jgi:hypothetical protein
VALVLCFQVLLLAAVVALALTPTKTAQLAAQEVALLLLEYRHLVALELPTKALLVETII